MKSWVNAGLKSAVKLMARGDYRRFIEALESPLEAQKKTLAAILEDQSQTEIGRELGLHSGLTREEFRAKLPISNFDDGIWSQWYARQMKSPTNSILVPGGARVWETTSGSSGTKKKIPYNAQMSSSFERYFKIWVYDILSNGPTLETLKIFMSISPGLREPGDDAGFNDDSEYLSLSLRWIVRRYLAAPLSLKSISDPERFRDLTCAHLLACPDLEVISVWHPSFFTLIWAHILKNRERLSTLLTSDDFPAGVRARKILSSETVLSPVLFWPNLKLISAWEAGQSQSAAKELRALFPQAKFQGKGLLATEAAMTIPMLKYGSVPFLTETFFEFRQANGELFFLEGLSVGETYEIIITQRGGFLRYTVGDQVRVVSQTPSKVPVLEFVSRLGDASDLVGEKLNGAYLNDLEIERQSEFGTHTYCILPCLTPTPHYLVLFDAPATDSKVSNWWDQKLSASFHFGYARKLGQLSATQAAFIPELANQMIDFYSSERKMKQGDIKLKTLVRDPAEATDLLHFLTHPKARPHGIA
jgi:hypothetical protein